MTRMTDERHDAIQQLPLYEMTDTRWREARVELVRARRAETEKDATITALADALEEERRLTGRGGCHCIPEPHPYVCITCRTDAALRLAGHLP